MIFDSDAVPVKVVRGEGVPGGGGLLLKELLLLELLELGRLRGPRRLGLKFETDLSSAPADEEPETEDEG